MLPFVPEPLESLKLRFHIALEKVWQVTDGMSDRPGLHREHMFDFESGMRLLISKDRLVKDEPEVHVSASWESNPPRTVQEMNKLVINGYRSLGGQGILHFVGWSKASIPHWVVEQES